MIRQGSLLTQSSFLWKLMKGNRFLYGAAIGAIGLSTFFSFMVPLIFKTAIDSILGAQPFTHFKTLFLFIQRTLGKDSLINSLWVLVILVVVLTIFSGLFSFLATLLSAQASEKTAEHIKRILYDHIQHLPFISLVTNKTGDLFQRCTSDVETIRKFISLQCIEIGRALFLLVLALPLMISLDRTMTLIAMALVPILFLYSLFFYTKVQKAFEKVDEAEARMTNNLQENLTGVRTVRAFGREGYEFIKFNETNQEFRDLTQRLIRILAQYWAISELLSLLQVGAIILAGIVFAIEGAITIGTLVAFLTYEGMILFPIRQLGRTLTDMGKAVVSLNRIKEVLDKEIETASPRTEHTALVGHIAFRHVYFSYNEHSPLLQNISFTVKAGMTVALIGATGSGKSTLVSLLLRLFNYTKGSIKIDGIELKNIDKIWLRKNISIVLQEPFLYAKTIKENIGLAKNTFTESEIVEATSLSMIHETITAFENGYDTLLGERGVNLSGGQKQRVAIARALIQKSPILIFDDSFSAVDNNTYELIRTALTKRAEKPTTFIISHRLTSIYDADLILVLDKGQIIESGTHEELLKKNDWYISLWNMQNNNEQYVDYTVS